MDPSSVLSRLGPRRARFRVTTSARGWLVARAERMEELLRAGLGPDGDPRLQPSDLVGKRPLERLESDGGALLVRRYHHGGLLRWLTGERFASPRRPLIELCLQQELDARGFLSPEVVAARAVRAPPWGWRLAVVTARVPDALDLGQALALRRAGRIDTRSWRALVGEVGRTLARLHEAGFLHADLTPRNLLVESSSLADVAPHVWVLDLDRSRWVDAMDEATRLENVGRLARHLERMRIELGLAPGLTDVARFLKAWSPRRDARRRAWRALLAGGRRPWTHRLGWWLERRLGRGRSGAEDHLRDAARG